MLYYGEQINPQLAMVAYAYYLRVPMSSVHGVYTLSSTMTNSEGGGERVKPELGSRP